METMNIKIPSIKAMRARKPKKKLVTIRLGENDAKILKNWAGTTSAGVRNLVDSARQKILLDIKRNEDERNAV